MKEGFESKLCYTKEDLEGYLEFENILRFLWWGYRRIQKEISMVVGVVFESWDSIRYDQNTFHQNTR
jgi:hypothetical protein